MAELNSSDRYEIIAELYLGQFGELAPGKDRPPLSGIQSDEERIANNERWSEWLTHRFNHPLERALEKIHCMQHQAEQREESLREASDAKAELRARIAQQDETIAELRALLSLSQSKVHATEMGERSMIARCDELFADNRSLTSANAEYAKRHLEQVETVRTLTAENAALRADRDRIDWQEANGSRGMYRMHSGSWFRPGFGEYHYSSFREALDAARGGK
jgi:chromosome segregation ATPase